MASLATFWTVTCLNQHLSLTRYALSQSTAPRLLRKQTHLWVHYVTLTSWGVAADKASKINTVKLKLTWWYRPRQFRCSLYINHICHEVVAIFISNMDNWLWVLSQPVKLCLVSLEKEKFTKMFQGPFRIKNTETSVVYCMKLLRELIIHIKHPPMYHQYVHTFTHVYVPSMIPNTQVLAIVREEMEFRGKSVIIFNDHYRWTKGTLLNTKTHVASLGYSAVVFYEHLKWIPSSSSMPIFRWW